MERGDARAFHTVHHGVASVSVKHNDVVVLYEVVAFVDDVQSDVLFGHVDGFGPRRGKVLGNVNVFT